jgi:hypothetical protein
VLKVGPEAPNRLTIPEALAEPVLNIERAQLEVVEFGEGESKHIAAVDIPGLKALLSADLVYNNTHLYFFAEAIKSGNPKAVEERMLAKYSQYQVRQFLSVFSIPAYFPITAPT